MDIETGLIKYLNNHEALWGITPERLFMLALPQEDDKNYPGGVTPAIVMQRISTPRTLTLSGDGPENPRFQFSVYAQPLKVAKDTAKLLNGVLDQFSGTLGDNVRTQILRADYRDSFEQETSLYRSDVDFFVMHSKRKKG